MKVPSIFLAVSLAISAAPAYAGGSMAPEVRVIVVQPSREIQRLDRIIQHKKQVKRAAREAERARERAVIRAEHQAERDRKAADKAYARKLKCQRSVCKN